MAVDMVFISYYLALPPKRSKGAFYLVALYLGGAASILITQHKDTNPQ